MNTLKKIFIRFCTLFIFSSKKRKKFRDQHLDKFKPEPLQKQNSLNYGELRSKGLEFRRNPVMQENSGTLVQYSILNKMKEIELRNKIIRGLKIRVCFLIDEISRFTSNSVYWEMKKSNIFEPFIVLYDNREGFFTSFNPTYEHYLKSIDLFKKSGFDIFEGYDKHKKYIPIENFNPDIIILSAPYLDYSETLLSNIYLNINYLCIFFDYGLNTINSYDYHYNNRRIAACWKHIVPTQYDYNEIMQYSIYYGSNSVLLGYPKLDTYTKPLSNIQIPAKFANGNPIVIYAPHWSIRNYVYEQVNLSTFHIYHKYFLNLVKNNPKINFIYKPHPNLLDNVVAKNIMSLEQYKKYLYEWNDLPNGIIVEDGEYIDLFRKSDLLITDCGSFIGEWLPTDKPCMYLLNPERNQKTYMDGFSIMGRKIIEKYYLCHNEEDIDKYFKMIMFDKQDPMKEERCKLKDEIFINIGCAGKKIVEYLEEILTD